MRFLLIFSLFIVNLYSLELIDDEYKFNNDNSVLLSGIMCSHNIDEDEDISYYFKSKIPFFEATLSRDIKDFLFGKTRTVKQGIHIRYNEPIIKFIEISDKKNCYTYTAKYNIKKPILDEVASKEYKILFNNLKSKELNSEQKNQSLWLLKKKIESELIVEADIMDDFYSITIEIPQHIMVNAKDYRIEVLCNFSDENNDMLFVSNVLDYKKMFRIVPPISLQDERAKENYNYDEIIINEPYAYEPSMPKKITSDCRVNLH